MWPGLRCSDWLVWVKRSSPELGGGASRPGATRLETKGPLGPQNVLGVPIPEKSVEDTRLPKQQTSRTLASMRFSFVGEGRRIWDPGRKEGDGESSELLFVGCDQSLAPGQAAGRELGRAVASGDLRGPADGGQEGPGRWRTVWDLTGSLHRQFPAHCQVSVRFYSMLPPTVSSSTWGANRGKGCDLSVGMGASDALGTAVS